MLRWTSGLGYKEALEPPWCIQQCQMCCQRDSAVRETYLRSTSAPPPGKQTKNFQQRWVACKGREHGMVIFCECAGAPQCIAQVEYPGVM